MRPRLEYDVIIIDTPPALNAIVVTDMSDHQLFSEMERENRNRGDLTPWGQSAMYKDERTMLRVVRPSATWPTNA